MDISVHIHDFELKISVCDLLKGIISHNCDLGPSSYFMTKKCNFLLFLPIQNSILNKVKNKTYIQKVETRFPPTESQENTFEILKAYM